MKARRDAYQAISDPTRRAIIGMIANEPQKVSSIAEKFDMTRQAISLHLKILVDCGLIVIIRHGKDRFCEARLEQLGEVWGWVDQYRAHWESKPGAQNLFVKTKKGVFRPEDSSDIGV